MATKEVDVLICGSGSAGLCAATWLARCGISCTILEKRPGPMTVGQADGVQCRTVEVFDSFGLAEELLRDAYHVIELAFWSSDNKGGIKRTSQAPDTEPGLSHQPHVILNQARVNGIMLDAMERFNGQKVEYGFEVQEVTVDSEAASMDSASRCVEVVATKDGQKVAFKARYVLACDGAHSAVRRSLGFKMIGDSTDNIWGVMDVYVRTDFPDLRKKCTVRSEHGVVLLIPREGGSLVRLYTELGTDHRAKDVKLENLQESARKIFRPYTMEFVEPAWWSAYPIGQRHADYFHKDHRVFLTGDACHTHSPKAGQGMNTSLQDGYNIGWKLAAVLRGQCPSSLLETYVLERKMTAINLINFDREWTKLFDSHHGVSPEIFTQKFLEAGRYTAGLTARYEESLITSSGGWGRVQVGMRLPSSQVVRFCDAKAMQLVQAFPADGRWRVLILSGQDISRLQELAPFLERLANRYTPNDQDIDSLIEPIVLLSGSRLNHQQEQIPNYYWPSTGRWKIRDLHKVFSDDVSYHNGHGKAYEFYGVDPDKGAIIVVRPDQYVAKAIPLDRYPELERFFAAFFDSMRKV